MIKFDPGRRRARRYGCWLCLKGIDNFMLFLIDGDRFERTRLFGTLSMSPRVLEAQRVDRRHDTALVWAKPAMG